MTPLLSRQRNTSLVTTRLTKEAIVCFRTVSLHASPGKQAENVRRATIITGSSVERSSASIVSCAKLILRANATIWCYDVKFFGAVCSDDVRGLAVRGKFLRTGDHIPSNVHVFKVSLALHTCTVV
jgi:hypothetical protein